LKNSVKLWGHIIREIPYIMVILWGKTFGLRGVAILYYEDLF
jgi:hypothetical protein